LKDLSLSLGLGDIVKFTGRVNRRDLVNYLNAADIYVSTSHSDGTSLSLLEALAVGLPAVVTDVPANLEWIKDGYNGFIASRGSPQSVSDAVLKLVSNDELCGSFRERSRDIVRERADWDKNFEHFIKMFHSLVERWQSFRTSINSQRTAKQSLGSSVSMEGSQVPEALDANSAKTR
jgi:glycosyltransferase involved in cell wall biosynthesis